MKTHSYHTEDDGDLELYNLENRGYIPLWIEALYHWVCFQPYFFRILEYTEGDITVYHYDNQAEFLQGLKETKRYWVNSLDKNADMCLAGCAEKYGFLVQDTIDLTKLYKEQNKNE